MVGNPSQRGRHHKQDSIKSTTPRLDYKSLKSEENEIRLLRIAPQRLDSDSTLHCQLFHASLDDVPPYQALSYAWGDRSESQPIFVNSVRVLVTSNLKNALDHLCPRPGEKDLILWVDAICIDQQDIAERSIQTSKMRMIYQNAENVSIWLGMTYNGGDLAMNLARDLNGSTKENISRMIQDTTREKEFEALIALFRRQYWWRIWVIQEVSCAKSATVYCGDESISWTDLDNVCNILQEQETHLNNIYYKRLSYIRTLTHGGPRGLQLSRYSPLASSPPLLELLLTHKSKKSTDPRDKVYALVGISTTSNIFGRIDYSRSIHDTFVYTARHIITTSQKLDVICVKQHDVNQYDLPTWVPDWTRPPRQSGHTVIGLHHHKPSFSAAGESKAHFSLLEDGYVLKARGFVIDRIKAVGTQFIKKGPPSDMLRALHSFQSWWNIFVAFRGDSISAQATFARVISCANWMFDDDRGYQERLKAIFSLSKKQAIRYTHDPYDEEQEEMVEPGLADVDMRQEDKTQMAVISSASLTMNRRRLFISSKNITGLAPRNAESGDVICVLLGCRFPVVLRGQGDHYILIGEAYVEGMMDGEAMLALQDGEFVLEDFEVH